MKGFGNFLLALAKQRFGPGQIIVRLAFRRSLAGCESVLDIGCGVSRLIRQVGLKRSLGIEGHFPTIEAAKKLNTHDLLVLGDIRRLNHFLKPRRFDACMAIDVIEHLSKDDGFNLLYAMENLARKKVIVFTPCGFLSQGHLVNEDLQNHLSGWEPGEMRSLGYRVVGLLGPKCLRGEYHNLKYRPKWLWGIIAILGHFLWTRWHPERAAAILCIKKVTFFKKASDASSMIKETRDNSIE